MKNVGTHLIIALLLNFSIISKAESFVQNCLSVTGSGHQLALYIVDGELKQLRNIGNATHPHAILVNKLLNQNIKDSSVYSVSGALGLLVVENKVLAGEIGSLELDHENFSCMRE